MADIGGAQARIKKLEALLDDYRRREVKFGHNWVKLRRKVDNIKIRAYELGCKELHDMAVEALQETEVLDDAV